MKLRFFLLILLLVLLNLFAFGQESSSKVESDIQENTASNPHDVNYCDLLKKPDDYTDKFIRVEAILRFLTTLEYVLHVQCEPKVSAVSVGYADKKFDELSDEIFTKMYSLKSHDLKVTVIGKFLGLRNPTSKYNYGHYGWSKYLFEIHTIEKIENKAEK